ncbi:hypothetical protein DER46DRAFT_597662 [Fusarium sp. MPI-SDFR-AT-0072]|nr:hypothetical protein DER46DRAFT_597662 [Fusarium sp. MPI-SDFR-AT-0072]
MQSRYLWLVTVMLGLNNVFDAILIAQKPWCSLQPAPSRTAPDLRCKWSDDKQFAGEKRRVRVRVGTGFAPQTIVHKA